jgi:hypothetical protein
VTVRGQLPPLRVPRKVNPIIESWREPVSFGEISARVSDPTRRDLDEILAELAAKQASAAGENPRPREGDRNDERVTQES